MAEPFDLVVIGGGPAGASGADRAALLGKRVALVERCDHLGGAGINTGTIPSKTLRETALVLSGWRSRRLGGVDLSVSPEATLDDLSWRAHKVERTEREGMRTRLERDGVRVIHGAASFVDPHTVRVIGEAGEALLSAEKFLIATGSSPVRPPEFAFADDRIHDSDEILSLKTIPDRLVVVGAGVIGCEYAGTFAALGVEVHVVDGRGALLPFLDEDIADTLTEAMVHNGIRFHWNARVVACDSAGEGPVVLTLSSGETLAANEVLVCAGRQSNTATLNLGEAGVTPGKRGLIAVNERYQSSATHIYAAGDVIGAPALAATGIEQGRAAVAHAFGAAVDTVPEKIMPTGIYTIPEASMVGDTEAALRQQGVPVVVGRGFYADLPRGDIIGDRTGFLKLVFARDGMRLRGVHIVGEQATELVHIGLIALLAGAGAEIFARACFNYPTLGDLYKHAADDALDQIATEKGPATQLSRTALRNASP
ncbi:MAG: Si-specific NAD(P)(+) transhydrogenase [Novosphingobium sp.]